MKNIHKREEIEMLKQRKFLFLLATMLLLIVGCAANDEAENENSNNGNDGNGTEEASGEHEAPKIEDLDPEDPKTETIKYGEERSEEHTSELQSRFDLVCRLLLEKNTN